MPANPIDSNQLSLKFQLEINRALEASWKYLSNHMWWCCVKLYFYVLFIWFMVDYLQGIMRMGVPLVWRWWVMLTYYCGPWTSTTHKNVCDTDLVGWCIQGCSTLIHAQRYDILMADIFPICLFLNLFPKQSQ